MSISTPQGAPPCRDLDGVTFQGAGAEKQVNIDFAMVKVYLAKGGNPLHQRLLQQYGIKGVPTVLLLDTKGKERLDLCLVDYIPPDQFMGRVSELKKTGS